MSHENVEVVRRSLTAFLSGDIETALSYWDPEGEWIPRAVEGTLVYRGHEALRAWLRDEEQMLDAPSFELLEELSKVGDRVLATFRERGRARLSGIPLDETVAVVYEVDGGRITRGQVYATREEALEAVGLSE
jgi:ketosteroid isomerase-like protein